MIAKLIEIHDSGTFIPALAVRLEPADEAERYLLARAGYGVEPETQGGYVLLLRLEDDHYSPESHGLGARTMIVAHRELIRLAGYGVEFDALESGEVVDVQHILGETTEPKLSERLTGGAL
jgi:hypothetical protein